VKIVTIILGILLTVGGIYCFAAPGATFLTHGLNMVAFGAAMPGEKA
jgi:hypothetical protein